MSLTVFLIPGRGHRYVAAALAALGHQTSATDTYRICVLGTADGFAPGVAAGGPAVSFVPADAVPPPQAIGDSKTVLVLRSDVAVYPDAVARLLANEPAPDLARLARVRQTPADVQSGFHQYVEWHTGREAVAEGEWPRLRWFDGLALGREHWLAARAVFAETRPPAVTLLELECRLRRAGVRVAAATGWTGHMIEPATFDSFREEAESVGRHAWALSQAWPESALATDLGLSTAVGAAAEGPDPVTVEIGAGTGGDADDEAPRSILEWRDAIGRWHLGVRQAFAKGLRQAAPPEAWPSAGADGLVAGADEGPRSRVIGRAVTVEADSRLMAVDVNGHPGFRVLRSPSGGYHAYFVVHDAPRWRRTPLDVVVEYLDRGRVVWGLDYDSTDRRVQSPPEPPGAFKRADGTVVQEDSGTWKTQRFTLPDWCFHRRCHGADVRLIGLERQDDGIIFGDVTIQVPFAGTSAPRRVTGDLLRPVALPATTAPAVSIVVPTHDALPFTRQCLHAVARTVAEPYEVIVVDNASSDETRAYVASCGGVRLLRRDRNDSFAAGCNAGARLARAPLIVFLNNDTVALPGWLPALTWPLERLTAGITGARLLFPDWTIQHGGIEWTMGQARHVCVHRPADCVDADRARPVFGVTGACLAVRRDTFWDVGGFDEGYRFGYEDLDLCMKVRELGLPTVYCPQSTLVHYQGASGRDPRFDDGNRARFLRRWSALVAPWEPY